MDKIIAIKRDHIRTVQDADLRRIEVDLHQEMKEVLTWRKNPELAEILEQPLITLMDDNDDEDDGSEPGIYDLRTLPDEQGVATHRRRLRPRAPPPGRRRRGEEGRRRCG
jgi:hypothetical protein